MTHASPIALPAPLFVDRVREHATRQPDALALRALGGERRFAELVARSERIAARLREQGCRPGDRIVVIGHSSIFWLDVMIGAMFARCAFAPLSTALTITEQAQLLEDAAPQLVFAGRAFVDTCPFPAARKVVLEDLEAWIAAGSGLGRPDQPRGDDIFSIIYSSGTTGVPKGIAHSAGARADFVALRPRAGTGCLTLLSTTLYTNFSFLGVVGPLYHGGGVSVMTKFSVEGFMHAVQQERVTDTTLVPVQVRRILDHPEFDPAALITLQFTMVSGSPVAPATKAQMAELWPGRIIDAFGTTETGGIASLDLKADPERLDTVGKLMPKVEIVTLDDEGNALPAGAMGEIAAITEVQMEGYYNRDQLTATTEWRDNCGRRFLRTGDVGWLDSDGYLHITGRAKDMIISGGLNIYATDIEDVLCAHPAVAEAAVIAIPDRDWGERPYAIVGLRSGHSASPSDLLAWLDGRIARTSRPAEIQIIDALPRNDMGKVLKRVLREPFWADRADQVA